MSDPGYEAMAKSIIYGVQQTKGPVEIDVSSIEDPIQLKLAIEEKGYEVGEDIVRTRLRFVVSLPERRIYPLINNHRQGS
jgi:hypothetical protein